MIPVLYPLRNKLTDKRNNKQPFLYFQWTVNGHSGQVGKLNVLIDAVKEMLNVHENVIALLR